jgi:hypothetical protein
MKKDVNPVVALVIILFTVGVAGLLLWYKTRERSHEPKFSAEQLQRLDNVPLPTAPHKRQPAGPADAKRPVKPAAHDAKE